MVSVCNNMKLHFTLIFQLLSRNCMSLVPDNEELGTLTSEHPLNSRPVGIGPAKCKMCAIEAK